MKPQGMAALGVLLLLLAVSVNTPQARAAERQRGRQIGELGAGVKKQADPTQEIGALKQQQQMALDKIQSYVQGVGGLVGTIMALVILVIGLLSLLFGWAIVRALFVPFCVLVGIQTGWAFGWAISLQLTEISHPYLLTIGLAFAGAVFYGFVGWKAKPIGVYLMVMSPFLVGGLATIQAGMAAPGYLALGIGFALGFIAMRRIRFFMVVGTSLTGTELVIAAGLIIWGVTKGIQWMSWYDSFITWTITTPWMPLVFAGVIFLFGANTQFTIGPGDLESKEREKWRSRRRPGSS